MVPYAVLDKLESPSYIQILWNYDQRRIIIRPATETTEEAIDVPKEEFDDSLLSLTTFLTKNPIDAMGWGKTPYELEAELVRDNDDHIALLLDLKKAHPVEQINGCLAHPAIINITKHKTRIRFKRSPSFIYSDFSCGLSPSPYYEKSSQLW